MFIRLKRHHDVCRDLETELLHALHETHRLHEELRLIKEYASRLGGPYKCLIECRELARALPVTGEESQRWSLIQLSHIDTWIRALAAPLTQGGKVDYFHQKAVLKLLPVEEIYRDIRFGHKNR